MSAPMSRDSYRGALDRRGSDELYGASDRLPKQHMIQPPADAIGEYDPLAPMICCVVDRLLDMSVFEFEADRLHLDQECQLCIELDCEVAERAADAVLAGELGILVIAEYFAQGVLSRS